MKNKYLVVYEIDKLFSSLKMRTIINCAPDELEEHIYTMEAKEQAMCIWIYPFC